MEKLHAPGLGPFKGGDVIFFHNRKIYIQDHGVVALVHTNTANQGMPQSKFI
jgi:hypothetical protein